MFDAARVQAREELTELVKRLRACAALGARRATYYRHHRRAPPRTVPELVPEGLNRVWSWDTTKLKGPVAGVYYCLYTINDFFSCYTVGWMIAGRKNNGLAERFLSGTVAK
ncbi:hypothetical protein ACWD5V_36745 [Streptomyces sp. NPDC002523]